MWPLTKTLVFTSPYSLKECKKALTSLESLPEITVLAAIEKTIEATFQLSRCHIEENKLLAYTEAEVHLVTNKLETIDVRVYSKIYLLQILLYVCFIVGALCFAFILRQVLLLSAILLLFTYIAFRWLRLVFINRERLISAIVDALGMD